MTVLAIDPGPTKSAAVVWDGEEILFKQILDNSSLLDLLSSLEFKPLPSKVAIEQIRGYGITAGNELFDTCIWTGRFQQACTVKGHDCVLIPRKSVVLHLCDHARAGDSQVRAALIDRFGPPGTKKEPGKTYGIANDLWAALAVAVCVRDQQ